MGHPVQSSPAGSKLYLYGRLYGVDSANRRLGLAYALSLCTEYVRVIRVTMDLGRKTRQGGREKEDTSKKQMCIKAKKAKPRYFLVGIT